MRVITGTAKGHKLKAPKGTNTRPTTDKMKETLFNIINVYSDDIVLDLFAGSGSIGIEFLSRGAEKCFFIDNEINSYKTIIENLEKTNFKNKSEIYKMNYNNALNLFRDKNIKFHYIFLDPPYKKNLIIESIKLIEKYDLLTEDGVIIAEHEKDLNLNIFNEKYNINIRNYGETSISFFKIQEA
ncbi:16S rRNA (guanine(966)-N(2))-methyltransferase RsmD [Senegalia massiliensis]|uniref:16S rRNA (guanine(966)-N(2))-methyltransferase RsmD n=1 Tax=Senegalia massiliensis TaxID=1720316 RepID=UPI00102F8882|nr:16S rRNA (guanine(966)-N(2))-methyltransferase RsmD [Senegalia massiliensis]